MSILILLQRDISYLVAIVLRADTVESTRETIGSWHAKIKIDHTPVRNWRDRASMVESPTQRDSILHRPEDVR